MTEEEKKIIREAVELANYLKEQVPDGTRTIAVRNALSLLLAEIIVTQTLVYPLAGLEALKDIHTYIAYVIHMKEEGEIKKKKDETTDIEAN